MDETTELLRVIIGRLEEMSATLRGLDSKISALESKVDGMNERLEKVEERMDYFFTKWQEHDEAIHKLRRRQV